LNLQYFWRDLRGLIVGGVEEGRLTPLNWLGTLLVVVGDNVEIIPLVLVDGVVELLAIDLDSVAFDTLRLHVLIENPDGSEQRPTHIDVHARGVALVLSQIRIHVVLRRADLVPVRHLDLNGSSETLSHSRGRSEHHLELVVLAAVTEDITG
jgi:hypothetical protein